MGLILPQEVEVSVLSSTYKYYQNKGYKIPTKIGYSGKTCLDIGNKIKINVLDLSLKSNQKVKVKCDVCGEPSLVSYLSINLNHKNGGYSCHKCCQYHDDTLLKKENKDVQIKETLIKELTDYINKNGYPYSIKKCFNSKNGLHSCKSYQSHLGDNLVDWIEACGFVLSDEEKNNLATRGRANTLSKDEVIKVVLNMQNKLNRPLMYCDFKNPKMGEVGVTEIKHYWGSMNKMKKELGLKIVQVNMMDKQLSKEETVLQIKNLCEKVKSEGRDFIVSREIGNSNGTAEYSTLIRLVKKYFDMSFSDYIKLFGVRMGNQGNGIVFKFEDGEITTSQYEFMFSKFLRDSGLKYNINYFRDVKYKDFVSNYKGNMNCDYVIKYNNKIIYIEIAGIIADYKTWYYEDRQITQSKSKDSYRVKLKQKEKMLHNADLLYFILFPCDLTNENFASILKNSSLELRHNIESFMKNNIDWVKIQEIGELKYKDNEVSCYGQKIVDYDCA